MKKRIIAWMMVILLYISTFSVAFVRAKYSKIDFITQNLNVSISNGEGEPTMSVGKVTLNYWTYNGTENVLARQEVYPRFGQEVAIWGEAPASGEGVCVTYNEAGQYVSEEPIDYYENALEGNEFVGWSITGLHCTNKENNHIATYKSDPQNPQVVPLVRLQAEQGFLYTLIKNISDELEYVIEPVINLYDVYAKNTITIRQHPLDEVNDRLGYTLVRLAAWDDLEILRACQAGEEVAADTIPYIVQYQSGEYVHGDVINEAETEVPPELKELMDDMGTFKAIKYYRLTGAEDSLEFYFHPGRVYSSSFGGFECGMGTPKYETLVPSGQETVRERRTTSAYLYLTDQSLLEENIFMGGVAPNASLTFYAADDTPTDSSVVERSDVGYLTESSSSGVDIACFTTGTLVTLADGSKIPVEDLTDEHILRVYDHENGRYTAVPALLINYDGDKLYKIAKLNFADGESLEIINERGLFDITLNKYVYITPDNCKQFIGHKFAKEKEHGFIEVELVNAYKEFSYTGCYSVTSTYYINHFINGYLTVPGGFHWFVNYFEYGENLQYDAQAMARDIEIYGLYTVEDFAAYVPEDMLFLFDTIYPAKYLKVTVGKGLADFEDILAVIQDWIIHYDLSGKLEQMKPSGEATKVD